MTSSKMCIRDRAGAIATPLGLLVLLLVFDWRLGLLSVIPVVLAFIIMMSMTGAKMQQKMKEYQNALDDMSNEAVEYVRGIPVVKTFGQTVFSFKRFKGAIDSYGKWVIAYTKQLRLPMMIYTTAINSVFVFLIAAALLFTADGVTASFLLNLIFYIIITPIITVTSVSYTHLQEAVLKADFHWYVKDGGLTPPQTGAAADLALWCVLGASALLLILLLVFKRRKGETRHGQAG